MLGIDRRDRDTYYDFVSMNWLWGGGGTAKQSFHAEAIHEVNT
jgi:hypothetical protein